MAFNERALWKFLYENDNGEFHSLNKLLLEQYKEGDEIEIAGRLQYFGSGLIRLSPDSLDTANEFHVSRLRREGNSLHNFPIKAKITADGRVYYQKAYLAQDEAEAEEKLTRVIHKANIAVIATAFLLIISIVLQAASIYVTYVLESKNQEQEKQMQQIEITKEQQRQGRSRAASNH